MGRRLENTLDLLTGPADHDLGPFSALLGFSGCEPDLSQQVLCVSWHLGVFGAISDPRQYRKKLEKSSGV